MSHVIFLSYEATCHTELYVSARKKRFASPQAPDDFLWRYAVELL
jgi:hypothetical protein